ncbi:MAG: right-handed parallel beta-helix repeat-containing protein, partial [Bacteroidaceae bacterium]|nr:right-handed parallel beta-helix repeat-containing protein [Bacteroidaceae bacterium]
VEGRNLLPVWTEMKYAEGKVEVVDENAHLCRVKCNGLNDMREEELKNSYIRIPQWFVMNTYKISLIKDDYVYFVYRGLQKVAGVGWNVNYDCYYGGTENVRYSLCNVVDDDKKVRISDDQVRLPEGSNVMHECTSYQFLTIKDCIFKSVNISGLKIIGNAWYMSYLINLENVISNRFKLKDCSFECMESDVISIKSTPNVTIERCSFKNCYRGCVVSDINSQNTVVADCLFDKVGLDFENTASVKCQGSNYHIKNNTFRDFGYSAISLGYGKTRTESQEVSGVTEYNTIEFTKDYVEKFKTSMLMDGGAIYVMTQNDKCVIRYNIITRYTGMKDNRGIFCDDGAYNVEICGNVITGIENSYCIDSRRVASVEKNGSRGNNVTRTNVNNRIYDNIVDGVIRFEPHEGDDNGCLFGPNYVVSRDMINGRLAVSKSDYKNIRKTPALRHVRSRLLKN